MKKVGVLSLQGDFAAHGAALQRAGAEPVYVREREQLDRIAGLIIPGGESTTMLKLLRYEGLYDAIREFGRTRPMFGTCAGAILMAKEVSHPAQESFGLMDIAIERNAYGRQIDSSIREAETKLGHKPLEMVFIRAPKIVGTGKGVEVLAAAGGDPVLVRQGKMLAATFHPELSEDTRVHQEFVKMVKNGHRRK